MPPPRTKMCNKTKHPVQLASGTFDHYVGWTTRGWVTLRPGKCQVFREDAVHVRGKHTVVGLAKTTRAACVLAKKSFRVTIRSAAECKQKQGHMVPFTYARYLRKRRVVPVDVIK